MENPALRQVSRSQPAPVIPVQQNASILNWLENSGRLLARESTDIDFGSNQEEITALIAGEDNSYDVDDVDDDDDDDVIDLDD